MSIKYSDQHDLLLVHSSIESRLDFVDPSDFSLIRTLDFLALTDFDVEDGQIILKKYVRTGPSNSIYAYDYDSDKISFIVDLPLIGEDVEYFQGKIYVIRWKKPAAHEERSLSYSMDHPYQALLTVIDPSTGRTIAEYEIQTLSTDIHFTSDNKIVTTGRASNWFDYYEGLYIEGTVNIIDENSGTVDEWNLFEWTLYSVVSTIDDTPVYINLQTADIDYAYPTTFIVYDMTTWYVIDAYAISPPGESCLMSPTGKGVATSAGILYLNLDAKYPLEGECLNPDSLYLGRVDLNTGEYSVTEFSHPAGIVDMTVKEGTNDIVYLLTADDQLLVFEF